MKEGQRGMKADAAPSTLLFPSIITEENEDWRKDVMFEKGSVQ